MRVLMMTNDSSLMDGINRHILTVSSALRKNGVEAAVCTAHPGGDLAAALKSAGVKSYSLGARNGHDVRILHRLDAIMKDFRPDVCHIHVMPLMARALFSTKYRKIKFVATVHGIGDPVGRSPIRDRIKSRVETCLQKLFKVKMAATCYISKGVRDHCRTSRGGTQAVIYNPIGELKPAGGRLCRELGLSEDVPVIGTACRFADVKQPVAFVEVMCNVLEKMKNAHAVLIGDGEADIKGQMQTMISRNRMEDRFHWLGYRIDSPELVGGLSMFVITSKSEGMPTAVLEAMAQRVPVALMKGEGGLVDLCEFDRGNGGIAVVGDGVSDLSRGIVACLGDANACSAMVERAMRIIRRYFSSEAVAKQLLDVYNEVCSG